MANRTSVVKDRGGEKQRKSLHLRPPDRGKAETGELQPATQHPSSPYTVFIIVLSYTVK